MCCGRRESVFCCRVRDTHSGRFCLNDRQTNNPQKPLVENTCTTLDITQPNSLKASPSVTSTRPQLTGLLVLLSAEHITRGRLKQILQIVMCWTGMYWMSVCSFVSNCYGSSANPSFFFPVNMHITLEARIGSQKTTQSWTWPSLPQPSTHMPTLCFWDKLLNKVGIHH